MTTPASSNNSRRSPPADRSARLLCAVAPSRFLISLLALIALQSLILLWLSHVRWYLWSPLGLLVFGIVWFEWLRLRATRGVLCSRERRWYWQPFNGTEREFEICGELVLWRWLIVINGRDLNGGHLRLVLAYDSASADDWRRLQVALRFSR